MHRITSPSRAPTHSFIYSQARICSESLMPAARARPRQKDHAMHAFNKEIIAGTDLIQHRPPVRLSLQD